MPFCYEQTESLGVHTYAIGFVLSVLNLFFLFPATMRCYFFVGAYFYPPPQEQEKCVQNVKTEPDCVQRYAERRGFSVTFVIGAYFYLPPQEQEKCVQNVKTKPDCVQRYAEWRGFSVTFVIGAYFYCS